MLAVARLLVNPAMVLVAQGVVALCFQMEPRIPAAVAARTEAQAAQAL